MGYDKEDAKIATKPKKQIVEDRDPLAFLKRAEEETNAKQIKQKQQVEDSKEHFKSLAELKVDL